MKNDMPATGEGLTHIDDNIFQPNMQAITDNISTELLLYGQSKPDVISLAQGDGHLKTPTFICDAASHAMQEGKTHYSHSLGIPEFRNTISNYYKNIFETDVPQDRIFVTSSGTTAMHLALTSILKQGDEVICVTPIWRNLMGIISLAGGTPVEVSLDHNTQNGWTLDLEKMFDAVTPRTKAIMITSPSNPTGWVMKHEEMQAVLNFCRQRKLWIVADSVYHRVQYGQKTAPDFQEIIHDDDLVYSVNSFSKTWAMTGWRLGWLTGPKRAAKVIQNIALYETFGTPTFNQYAGMTALNDGEEFIAEQMSLWQSNLDLICERFDKNDKIEFTRPDAAFYAFFKIKGEDDCVTLCRRLIDEARVSVAPGQSFGSDFTGWLRLSYATSQEELIEALNRLETEIK